MTKICTIFNREISWAGGQPSKHSEIVHQTTHVLALSSGNAGASWLPKAARGTLSLRSFCFQEEEACFPPPSPLLSPLAFVCYQHFADSSLLIYECPNDEQHFLNGHSFWTISVLRWGKYTLSLSRCPCITFYGRVLLRGDFPFILLTDLLALWRGLQVPFLRCVLTKPRLLPGELESLYFLFVIPDSKHLSEFCVSSSVTLKLLFVFHCLSVQSRCRVLVPGLPCHNS